MGVHWKDWCWNWNSNTLATSWEELTHWKRPWCWEGLGTGGERDGRGWDGWWHHSLDGDEFESTSAVGDGQGGLVCCNSWGCKESYTTEQLNWTELHNYLECSEESGSAGCYHSEATMRKETAVLTQTYEKITQSYEKKWVIIA